MPIWGPDRVPVGMSPPSSIPSFVIFTVFVIVALARARLAFGGGACTHTSMVDYARELGVRGALISLFAAVACFSCLN